MRIPAALLALSLAASPAIAANESFKAFPSRFIGYWLPVMEDGKVCPPGDPGSDLAATIEPKKIVISPDFSCDFTKGTARQGFGKSENKMSAGSFVATVSCSNDMGKPDRMDLNFGFQTVLGHEILVLSNPTTKWISLFSKCPAK